MYPKFLDPKDVCKRLGACTKDIRTFLATPTCDECRGSITRVAEVISSPEQDAEIVAFLQVTISVVFATKNNTYCFVTHMRLNL